MLLDIRLNHSDASTGHAHDVKLYVFAPAYMAYDRHDGMALMSPAQTETSTSDENSLRFAFGVS